MLKVSETCKKKGNSAVQTSVNRWDMTVAHQDMLGQLFCNFDFQGTVCTCVAPKGPDFVQNVASANLCAALISPP